MEDHVDYTIDKGLIFMLAGLANIHRKEVWSELADMTRECVGRIQKRKHQRESWKWFTFPNTDINMKVKVYSNPHESADGVKFNKYHANIKLDRNGMDKFTSTQVNEFLIEEVLLGDEEAVNE